MVIKEYKVIPVHEWDKLVSTTYGRIYSLQQQGGCMERQMFHITVPDIYAEEDDLDMNDSIPEKVNGGKMGVKFSKWLERDPNLNVFEYDYENTLFWKRNFYPAIGMVINDLHKKELLKEGEYYIKIDW